MSDVSWAALVGACAALAGSVVTQTSLLIKTHMQRKNKERRRAQNKKESRAIRKKKALRQCWGYVLATRIQVYKLMKTHHANTHLAPDEMPTVVCGHACTVALLELPEVYWFLKDLYEAVVQMEAIMAEPDLLKVSVGLLAWDKSFQALEEAVAKMSGVDWEAGKMADQSIAQIDPPV